MRPIAVFATSLAAMATFAGAFVLYSSWTANVVLFSHGTPEVPQGRMFTIFNPFRDRSSEETAERLIKDLKTADCPQIVRELDGEGSDSRVCSAMQNRSRGVLVWRRDGDHQRVLVYDLANQQARLWITFRRDEGGFVISGVSVVR